MLERVGALALAIERQRQIEARLMIERVGGDLLFQLRKRADRLCLLGQVQSCARGNNSAPASGNTEIFCGSCVS